MERSLEQHLAEVGSSFLTHLRQASSKVRSMTHHNSAEEAGAPANVPTSGRNVPEGDVNEIIVEPQAEAAGGARSSLGGGAADSMSRVRSSARSVRFSECFDGVDGAIAACPSLDSEADDP